VQCTYCRSELLEGDRFCSKCGTPVGAQAGSVTTGNVAGTGIAIGHGASASVSQGLGAEELAKLFDAVYRRIEQRPDDPEVDKEELAQTVGQVQREVAKGENANESKLRRWLKMLAELAPDVFDVTLAAIANPVAGVALAVRRVAERVGAEAPQG
jgi:hypothetical protein